MARLATEMSIADIERVARQPMAEYVTYIVFLAPFDTYTISSKLFELV